MFSEVAKRTMTNITEHKDVVRRFVQAMNDHDIEGAARLCAADLVNHAAIPEAQGVAGLRVIMKKLFDAMPDMRWVCEDLVAEGDRVVCRVTIRGTQTGPLAFARASLPATGRSVTTEHIHVFQLDAGKIVEHWAGRDDMGMLRQLGHLPFAGTAS